MAPRLTTKKRHRGGKNKAIPRGLQMTEAILLFEDLSPQASPYLPPLGRWYPFCIHSRLGRPAIYSVAESVERSQCPFDVKYLSINDLRSEIERRLPGSKPNLPECQGHWSQSSSIDDRGTGANQCGPRREALTRL
jgi:hypothetical protein